MTNKLLITSLIALFVLVPVPLSAQVDKIYWTDWDTNQIQRSNLDGTLIENIVIGLSSSPNDVAVDRFGARVYWCTAAGVIQSANLDGTGLATVVTGLSAEPNGLDVDAGLGKIYWTTVDSTISRANLDGRALAARKETRSDPAIASPRSSYLAVHRPDPRDNERGRRCRGDDRDRSRR